MPDMDISLRWSLPYQGLLHHSKATLLRGKVGARYSLHHNLYGHSEKRHPEIGWFAHAPSDLGDTQGAFIEFSNNTIWNWGDLDGGYSPNNSPARPFPGYLRAQFMGNYYDQGPDTPSGRRAFNVQSADDWFHFSRNNWDGTPWSSDYEHVIGSVNAKPMFVTEYTAEAPLASYARINTHGGASLPMRDVTDDLFLGERSLVDAGFLGSTFHLVHNISSNSRATPFAPGTGGDAAPADSDNDGMADEWEEPIAPNNDITKLQPSQDFDGDGWTNIEEYLNGTSPAYGNDPLTSHFPLHHEQQ